MRFLELSPVKLNLSLRVTKRRPDGYHDIVSLFLRLPGVESLSISASAELTSDVVRAEGVEISGENTAARVLRLARGAGFHIPFLDVEISKKVPPGSGLGAGSGNAAAVLRWLAGSARQEDGFILQNIALKTGADVPFLFSGYPLALASGIGEILEPLEPLKLRASVVFPKWSVGTENAYSRLDSRYGGCYPLSDEQARAEAYALHRKLLAGERAGLLPNDFAPGLIEKFPEYAELFDMFDKNGHLAWGITGSGGAAFALSGGVQARSAWTERWPSWANFLLTADTF